MEILYLQAYYWPEIVATTYITNDLIDAMIGAGHTVELIVPTPTRGVTLETRKEYSNKEHRYEIGYDGRLIIHRIPLFNESQNTIQRTIRYFVMNVQFVLKSVFKDFDVIFCESTPPTQGLMAACIKAIKKKPIVYNLQDVFPDSLITTGISHKNSTIWKIGRKIEDYTYRKVDSIITISDDFRKNILEKGVPESKIMVVPNWADVTNVHPVRREDNRLFDELHLERSKFYITYCGNIGFSQNMELLLSAAKSIEKENHEIEFVLFGDGAAKDSVLKQIEQEHISNVKTFPYQPFEKLPEVFSLGNISLIISKPGIGSACVPSKTFSIMAAEKPILASFDKNSELAHLIERVGCGVTVDAGEKEAFVEAIKTFYNKSKADSEFLSMGKLGREYLKTDLDKDKCVGMYVKTLESVCK